MDSSILVMIFACLVVVMICIVASVVATILVAGSLRKRRPVTASSNALQQPFPAGGSTGPLSTQEALDLRNLVFRTVAPRPEEILYLARSRYPNASRDELAQKIISSEASKCGFIGFVTGVPGLILLPVTLPIDLYMSGRLQAAMVQALAYLYEYDEDEDAAHRRYWMVMLGGGSLAKSLTSIVLKVIGPTTVKAVPIVGALAGYGANYVLAQAAGNAAMRHFKSAGLFAAEATLTLATVDTATLPEPVPNISLTNETLRLNSE